MKQHFRHFIHIIFSMALLLLPNHAIANDAPKPSFDCAKATTITEKTICSDTKLAQLDRELATAYRKYLQTLSEFDQRSLKLMQREWVKERESCGSDINRLVRTYEERLALLTSGAPIPLDLPTIGSYSKSGKAENFLVAYDFDSDGRSESLFVNKIKRDEFDYGSTVSIINKDREKLATFDISSGGVGQEIEEIRLWKVSDGRYILLLGVYQELMARSTQSVNDVFLITSDFKVKHLLTFTRYWTNGGTAESITYFSFKYDHEKKYFDVVEDIHYIDDPGSYDHYFLKYNEEEQTLIKTSQLKDN